MVHEGPVATTELKDRCRVWRDDSSTEVPQRTPQRSEVSEDVRGGGEFRRDGGTVDRSPSRDQVRSFDLSRS